jgi:hypothetical protein
MPLSASCRNPRRELSTLRLESKRLGLWLAGDEKHQSNQVAQKPFSEILISALKVLVKRERLTLAFNQVIVGHQRNRVSAIP